MEARLGVGQPVGSHSAARALRVGETQRVEAEAAKHSYVNNHWIYS